MTQWQMARALGIPVRQAQRHERGTSPISARRLYEFSLLLDVPFSYFLEGLSVEPIPFGSTTSTLPVRRIATSAGLHAALKELLVVVDLADLEGGIDEHHYQAAKTNARAALSTAGPVGEGHVKEG
jgi:transcriptional regulator with XRE-family HTH domain